LQAALAHAQTQLLQGGNLNIAPAFTPSSKVEAPAPRAKVNWAVALGPDHWVPLGVATNSSGDTFPRATWGRWGYWDSWAAMGRECLWSPLLMSRGPQERGEPLSQARLCVGMMSHPAQPMGRAGHRGKGALESPEQV